MRDRPDVTVVTGAAGWLGTALLSALCDPAGPWHRPGTVRTLVRTIGEARTMAARHADGGTGTGGVRLEIVIGDVTEPDDVAALVGGTGPGTVDVIHTAGIIHPKRTVEFTEVNVIGTRNVVDAARASGVRRLVHVSSNSPFGTNPDPQDRFRADEPYHPYYGYGWSKMEAELAVFDAVDAGLDAVIVRPPWFYGPHQPPRQTTFFQMIRAGRFPIVGDGTQRRSMVYVDNLVQGLVRAELVPTPPGQAWWIADERPYPLTEIVETVAAALADEGLDVASGRLRVPSIVAGVAEMADAVTQRLGRYVQQAHVLGEMSKTIACDISGARADLGYEPEVDLAEGMRRSIRWCLEQGLLP